MGSTSMEVKNLLDGRIEAKLRNWISSFDNAAKLYAGLSQLFSRLDRQYILGRVEDGAIVIGPVHIGSRSVVRTGSIITGPAIIGEDVTISPAVEIGERTYIGSRCSVEHGVTIKNSLILNGTSIGAGAYVCDSLIGTRCVIGQLGLIGVEPKGRNSLPFVIVGKLCRIGAGAILEYGAAVTERTTVDNGAVVGRVPSSSSAC
jgi:NDP-sugar pyrophosphorylase family protein